MSERNSTPPPPRIESGESHGSRTTLTLDRLWDQLSDSRQRLILQTLTRMIQQSPPISQEADDE